MTDKATPVVFRMLVSKPPFDCIALFPTIPFDYYGKLCLSYEHCGQHGAADYDLCIRKTRPALQEEYAELKEELEERGYNIRVIKRATRKYHDARRNAAS